MTERVRVPNLALFGHFGVQRDAYPTADDAFGDLEPELRGFGHCDLLRQIGINPIPARSKGKRPKFYTTRSSFDAKSDRPNDPIRPPAEDWNKTTSPIMSDETMMALVQRTVGRGEWSGACAYVGPSPFTVFDFDLTAKFKKEVEAGTTAERLKYLCEQLWIAVEDFIERIACPVALVATGKGLHVWVLHPEDTPKLPESNPAYRTCVPEVHVEVRSSKGFVVAPGSGHASKGIYTYLHRGTEPGSFEQFFERMRELTERGEAADLEALAPLKIEKRRRASGGGKGGGGTGKYVNGGEIIDDADVVTVVSSDLRHRSRTDVDLAGQRLTMGEVAELTHPTRGDYTEIRVVPTEGLRWGRTDTESGHGCKWWGPAGGEPALLVFDYAAEVFWTRRPRAPLAQRLISICASGALAAHDKPAGEPGIDFEKAQISRLLGFDAWHELEQSFAALGADAAVEARKVAEAAGLPNVEVVELPAGTYVSDHLAPMAHDELLVLITPHGTGKTTYIAAEVGRAKAAQAPIVAVQPTQALTEVNAARLDIVSQYAHEDAVEGEQVSCCVNTLPRVTLPFEGLFVADEYEQSDAYMHTGKVEQPLAAYDAMREGIMQSRKAVVSSASLPFEQFVLLMLQVRRHNPNRRVRVAIQPPKSGTVRVHACKLGEAYARLDDALARAADDPEHRVVVCCTSKKLPREMVRLCEKRGLTADYVSGENSRLAETREKLRDPKSLIARNQVLYLNPAVGSGVDFPEADEVIVLDLNPNLPVEMLGQLARRVRRVSAGTLIWGLKKWSNRKDVRYTDAHLDRLACARAEISDAYVTGRLPQWRNDYETGERKYLDPEFAQSWRLHERIRRQSLAEPLGRRHSMWASYGWEITDNLGIELSDEVEAAAKATRAEIQQAKDEVKGERIDEVVKARNIDEDEAEEIRTAHEHEAGDREALTKFNIREFYGLQRVEHADVEFDDDGKGRKACRKFVAAKLDAQGEEGQAALANHDARRNMNRHMAHKRSQCFEAECFNEVLRAVLKVDAEAITFQRVRMQADDVRDAVLTYLDEHGDGLLQETLGLAKRSRSGDDKYALRAFNALMRRYGARVTTVKSSGIRWYSYDFAEVDKRSAAEYERIVERYRSDMRDVEARRKIRNAKKARKGAA